MKVLDFILKNGFSIAAGMVAATIAGAVFFDIGNGGVKTAHSAEIKLQAGVNIVRGVNSNGYFVEVPVITPGGCVDGEYYSADTFDEFAWRGRYYELFDTATPLTVEKDSLCRNNTVVDLLTRTRGRWVMADHDLATARVTIYAVEGGEPSWEIESPAFREDLEKQIRKNTDSLFQMIKQFTG
jgi:hypothetical protein